MQINFLKAGVIIIGNEILSGKTQDLNLNFIAKELIKLGIKLNEARIIRDVEAEIITTLNQLKDNDFIFTTGGIGPTHDDITLTTIAKAFNLNLIKNIEFENKLIDLYLRSGKSMSDINTNSALLPDTAELIFDDSTGAHAVRINNIYIMAGVPDMMQAAFGLIKKSLPQTMPFLAKEILTEISENKIAKPFEKLQRKFPEVEMGSYPYKINNIWHTNLVITSKSEELLNTVFLELKNILVDIKNEEPRN